jgi:trehalose/maltose hydrolase-like predicted phosphorylase
MLALSNGYLGMRGCAEEGGPNAENSILINGFYETRPIMYPEDLRQTRDVGILASPRAGGQRYTSVSSDA